MKKIMYIFVGSALLMYSKDSYMMDGQIIRQSDKTGSNKKLSRYIKPLDCESLDTLIADNAALLSSLVSVEQSGRYSPDLVRAEIILLQHSHLISSFKLLSQYYGCSFDSERFVRAIFYRKTDLAFLIKALKTFGTNLVSEICKKNRYVTNAYALYPDYGGIAAPLHYAFGYYVGKNRPQQIILDKIITSLVYQGACVNGIDYNGDTPLHKVCTKEQIKFLWRYGACSGKKNNQGMTPIMQYIANERADLAEFMLNNVNIPVTDKDNEGNTLLHYAITAGYVKVIHYLFNRTKQSEIANQHYGAKALCIFDIENQFQKTPADLAVAGTNGVKKVMKDYMYLYLCDMFIKKKYFRVWSLFNRYRWAELEASFDRLKERYPENAQAYSEYVAKQQIDKKQVLKKYRRKTI